MPVLAQPRFRRRVGAAAGMARAEWLLLMGLATALLSLALPWWEARQMRLHEYMARNDILAIQRACYSFFEDTGKWPTMHDGAFGDYRYGELTPNALVMNVLRAKDGPGNEGHRINPEQRAYLLPPAHARGRSGLDGRGEFLDPWGSPYQIVLDTDHDQSAFIERSAYGQLQGRNLAVWSYGRDRKPGTRHDILSWTM